MSFTCLLIGQDNLLIQCAQLLLDNRHQIKWVVSSLHSIQTWCETHDIPCVSAIEKLPNNKPNSVDYLFSIVNGKILNKKDLKIPRHGAINYHDSLLPKYAGVNATTWALINGENTHGITWHMINEGIDEGDIIYQSSFTITKEESALSLNLRCFEEAIKGFSQIIHQIETKTIVKQKQLKSKKSYYGINHVLPDLGFINFNTTAAEDIIRISQALYFGHYSNNVGLLKLYLGEDYLIVSDIALSTHIAKTQSAGCVIEINDQDLLISTISQPIRIKTIKDLNGQVLTPHDLNRSYDIKIGYQFPCIHAEFIQNNYLDYQQALRHEKEWISELNKIVIHRVFTDRMIAQNAKITQLPEINLNPFFMNTSNLSALCLATVMIYLYRINDYENFTLYWLSSNSKQNVNPDPLLFSNLLPITSDNLQPNSSLVATLDFATQKLNAIIKNNCYLKDLIFRQPALSFLKETNTHLKITIGLTNKIVHVQDSSLIHFEINLTSSKLFIHHRLNEHYHGGAYRILMANMPLHITHIMKSMIDKPSALLNQFSFLTKNEEASLFKWGVGKHRPLPSHTLHSLLLKQVKSYPKQIAVYEGKTQFTYQELFRRTQNVISFLNKKNLSSKKRIGIHILNTIDRLAFIIGGIKTGYTCIPMNPIDHHTSVQSLAKNLDMSIIFTSNLDLYSSIEFTKKEPKITLINIQEVYALSQNHTIESPFKTPGNILLIFNTDAGHPKKLLLTQKQLVNYGYWLEKNSNFKTFSILKLPTTGAFFSYFPCIFAPLVIGGSLAVDENSTIQSNHVVSAEYFQPQEMLRLVCNGA